MAIPNNCIIYTNTLVLFCSVPVTQHTYQKKKKKLFTFFLEQFSKEADTTVVKENVQWKVLWLTSILLKCVSGVQCRLKAPFSFLFFFFFT